MQAEQIDVGLVCYLVPAASYAPKEAYTSPQVKVVGIQHMPLVAVQLPDQRVITVHRKLLRKHPKRPPRHDGPEAQPPRPSRAPTQETLW